jgi:predicted nuclease of predicted toxin-antitoxin system
MPWVNILEVVKQNPPSKREVEQVFEYRRRKAKAKFYADENFPTAAVQLLRSNGVNMLTAREAAVRGHPDENHAAFAVRNARILLTCDRAYLDEQRFPLVHCPVIVVCAFGSASSNEMRQTFRCLRTMSSFPQAFDKWTKIEAKRESWTEYARFLNGTSSKTRYRINRGQLQEWWIEPLSAKNSAHRATRPRGNRT